MVLISNQNQELQEIITEIDIPKDTNIILNGQQLEHIETYKYLGQKITI